MKQEFKRQINLFDLIIDWAFHWKSLVVFILIGVIFAGLYSFAHNRDGALDQNVDATTLASTTTLSNLSEAQIASIPLDDIKNCFFTDIQVGEVDELVKLHDEYIENLEIYDSNKSSMDFNNRVEAFNNIASAKEVLDNGKLALTIDQRVLYNVIIKGQVKEDLDNSILDSSNESEVLNISKIKMLLVVIIFIILHFVITASIYLFNDRLKHSDDLYIMTGISENAHIINWDVVKDKSFVERYVYNKRFSNDEKNTYEDALAINAITTVEKMKKKNYSSVAVVCKSLDDREDLVRQIELQADSNVVKSIDSISHSVNGAKDIEGVASAVLAVRVGLTKYSILLEEIQALKNLDIDIIGISVFE